MKRPRHKFNAKDCWHDGICFRSKKEGAYYRDLKLRVKSGEVLFFLRQVPFDLPGGVRVWMDFLEFHSDGTVHVIDVKGHRTPQYIRNKKQIETLYPVEIEEA